MRKTIKNCKTHTHKISLLDEKTAPKQNITLTKCKIIPNTEKSVCRKEVFQNYEYWDRQNNVRPGMYTLIFLIGKKKTQTQIQKQKVSWTEIH